MNLPATLKEQKAGKIKGGIYQGVQIDLTYNSNHIEGRKLTYDQTRYIFEPNTIGLTSDIINVDDIIETTNHFRTIDYIIDETDGNLTEAYIKHLHFLLKPGTSYERKEKIPNPFHRVTTNPGAAKPRDLLFGPS